MPRLTGFTWPIQGDLSVVIFDGISTKNGTVNFAPTRIIAGANTSWLRPPTCLWIKVRNLLYVADDPDILVLTSRLSTGQTVTWLQHVTLMTSFAVIGGIFIDGTNDRLFVADQAGWMQSPSMITPARCDGAITPNRVVTGCDTRIWLIQRDSV